MAFDFNLTISDALTYKNFLHGKSLPFRPGEIRSHPCRIRKAPETADVKGMSGVFLLVAHTR
jgi:hypothetical protein